MFEFCEDKFHRAIASKPLNVRRSSHHSRLETYVRLPSLLNAAFYKDGVFKSTKPNGA